MPIIDFQDVLCRHCYRCIRSCETKAIRFSGGHAYIMPELCILCGQCYVNCPQAEKKVSPELSRAKELISSGKKRVVLSLQSADIGLLYGYPRGKVRAALEKLGFYAVRVLAEAEITTTRIYAELLEADEMPNIITTQCPSITKLIQIHYPEFIPYLAPVISPSGIHAQMLREEYGEDTVVVFAGTCIAEKSRDTRYAPDVVLTFDELAEWLREEQIDIGSVEEKEFNIRILGSSLRYPVSGGLITAVEAREDKADTYRHLYVSGIKDVLEVCEALKSGHLSHTFIEMDACHGGCLNGPAAAHSDISTFRVKLDLEERLATLRAPKELEERYTVHADLTPGFKDRSKERKTPDEEELRAILKKYGRETPEQQIDCGACGYPTCREKAVAVYRGMAEAEMCLPWLYDRASSLSHLILQTSPNAMFLIDRNLEILSCSDSVEKFFGKKPEEMKNRKLAEFISDEDVREVFETHQSIQRRKVIYPEKGLVTLQNIAYIPDISMVILTIINVAEEEEQAAREKEKQRETIELAQNVIYKQMMVAQQIAGLLGETTAETKTTLNKLCALIIEGNEGGEVR